MNHRAAVLCLSLAGCNGSFNCCFDDIGFADSAADPNRDTGTGCLEPVLAVWPADGEAVDRTATPELHLAAGVQVIASTWWTREDTTIEHSRVSEPIGDRAVLRLQPILPLAPDTSTSWTVSFEHPTEVLCTYLIDGQHRTTGASTAASAQQLADQAWWLPLDERADSSGVLIGRLLGRTGPEGGRAPSLALSGGGLWLGAVLRAPTLPADPCDATDTLALANPEASMFATAEAARLGDPADPFVLRDLELTGLVTDSGHALRGVRLKATLDLSEIEPTRRDAHCALAAQLHRPCAPCDSEASTGTCVTLDARGLSGARYEPGPTWVDGESCDR